MGLPFCPPLFAPYARLFHLFRQRSAGRTIIKKSSKTRVFMRLKSRSPNRCLFRIFSLGNRYSIHLSYGGTPSADCPACAPARAAFGAQPGGLALRYFLHISYSFLCFLRLFSRPLVRAIAPDEICRPPKRRALQAR